MVVVRAVTFNLISTIGYALWGTNTTLSERASNVYECGLACDSFADCGGFSWDNRKCQLVARVGEDVEDRPFDSNLYRMATFRGRRIVDRHKSKYRLKYQEYKQICQNLGMMMLPPPLNSREQMTIAIRSINRMAMGRKVQSGIFTDDFGTAFPKDGGVITWKDSHPKSDRVVGVMESGYFWTSSKKKRSE